MPGSLENHTRNLPSDGFKYTTQVFQAEKLTLMQKKGVYPYDYMHWIVFRDLVTSNCPQKAQYKHAQKVWNIFSCKIMGDYHDLYLESDNLLLADVFENFRETCLQCYKLGPTHYFTSPGLSWDAMLKMTGIKLELMTDIDQFQFIEKGMRGRISHIANRYGG